MITGTKKGGKGKGKSSNAGSKQGDWDWVRSRERILKALGALLTVDLAAILAASHERQRMVDMSVEVVSGYAQLQVSLMVLCT
jgi:hypothetical protein